MINTLPKSLIESATYLLESSLYDSMLLENRIQFLKDRNPEIDSSHDALAQHKTASDIIDHFSSNADPSKNKQHTQWILGQYKKKNIRQEDAPRIRDTLSNFDRYKSKLEKKDINQYKTLSDVSSAVQPHLGTAATRVEESQETISKGRTLIHDNGKGLKVYRLEPTEDGKKASQEIYGGGHEIGGTHTSWCTAARSKDCMFDHYSEKSPLHVIHTPTGNVYQAHPETKQLMDAKDDAVNEKKHSADINDISKGLDHVPNGWGLKLRFKLPTTNKILDKALGDKDWTLRSAAAEHPHISKAQLDKATHDEHRAVRVTAIKNKNTTKEQLDNAILDDDYLVRQEVARHPNATKEHIDASLDDRVDEIRRIAITNPNVTSEHLHMALSDENRYNRLEAVRHPNTTKEHLDRAIDDKEFFIREAVASHPNATKEHLDKLMGDGYVEVRRAIAANKNATKGHLDKLLEDEHYGVRIDAVANPSATPNHIDIGLNDVNNSVRRAAATNPNITSTQLDKALGDIHFGTRIEAAAHHNASQKHIDRALGDADIHVRGAAASNPNINKEQLLRALTDSISVQLAAKNNPKTKEYGII